MSRIRQVTEKANRSGSKLLIPYLVAGDPNIGTTVAVMHSLVEKGADIIELGIPFSDPASDGPVIQRAVERSLNKGTSLSDTLDIGAEFRKSNDFTPIVLMGYLNPIEIMGYDLFVEKAEESGIDGVLIVDMPPAESADLHYRLQLVGIDTIFLIAPTTKELRAKSIVKVTTGYLYYVSLKGVTGAALSDYKSVKEKVSALRNITTLPIVIGFGIKDGESAKMMAEISDGVVIGSALVEKIGSLNDAEIVQQEIEEVTDLIKAIRYSIDSLNL
jgi:tryptophan synthase alpha chain